MSKSAPNTIKISEQKHSDDDRVVIKIPEMPEKVLIVEIGGDGMLQNNMTTDAIRQIKGTATGGNIKDYTKRAEKWKETGHWTADGKLGFPAEAFLKGMGNALKGVELKNKKLFKFPKDLYRALHVDSNAFDTAGNGIVLYTKVEEVVMQEHMGMLKGTTPIPLYRLLAKNWKMELPITYNDTILTDHDVLLLLNRAGASVGVGAFRVENRGPYGKFSVLNAWTTQVVNSGKKAA